MEGRGLSFICGGSYHGRYERTTDKVNYLTLSQCDGNTNTNTRPRADIIRTSQAWCCLVFTQIRNSTTLCGSQTRKVIESGNVRGQTVDYPSTAFSSSPRFVFRPGIESIVGSYS
jgi:hypothetical protein